MCGTDIAWYLRDSPWQFDQSHAKDMAEAGPHSLERRTDDIRRVVEATHDHGEMTLRNLKEELQTSRQMMLAAQMAHVEARLRAGGLSTMPDLMSMMTFGSLFEERIRELVEKVAWVMAAFDPSIVSRTRSTDSSGRART